MREVEVAIGYTGGMWASIWVKIPDNGYVLSDAELTEKAEEEALDQVAAALKLTNSKRRAVSFVKVLYIDTPDDDLSC